MILAVTLNPAVDVTYLVGRLVPGSVNPVGRALQRGGGKGVNVARVAAACGAPVTATGLAGGQRGMAIRAGLAAHGIRDEFEPVEAESRQTVTVVAEDARHPTELREPGPPVRAEEWTRFLHRFTRLASEAGVVTMSGSLPPDVPADAYATLTAIAKRAGSSVIVDAGGDALRLACAAGPDIVKPNESELLAAGTATGAPVGRVTGAAEELRGLGAGAVVASLGRSGSVAMTPAGRWRITHDRVDGNPVGAGDALVAGLAIGLLRTAAGVANWAAADWTEVLRQASSLAMASVLAASAGEADPAVAAGLAGQIRLRAIGDNQR